METLGWILGSGLLMSAVALIGSVTLLLDDETPDRVLVVLVGFAAGSLPGGALFHMIPAGLAAGLNARAASTWFALGFTAFFGLEQLLHRHHYRGASAPCRRPVTHLILLGDGLQNFLGVRPSASDLIPEANRRHEGREALQAFVAFLAGLALPYALGIPGVLS